VNGITGNPAAPMLAPGGSAVAAACVAGAEAVPDELGVLLGEEDDEELLEFELVLDDPLPPEEPLPPEPDEELDEELDVVLGAGAAAGAAPAEPGWTTSERNVMPAARAAPWTCTISDGTLSSLGTASPSRATVW
jgi:hypothetical protein